MLRSIPVCRYQEDIPDDSMAGGDPRQQVEHGTAPVAGTQRGRRQRRCAAACHLQLQEK